MNLQLMQCVMLPGEAYRLPTRDAPTAALTLLMSFGSALQDLI